MQSSANRLDKWITISLEPWFCSALTDLRRSPHLSLLCRVVAFVEKCHCGRLIAPIVVDRRGLCEAIFSGLILWPGVHITALAAVLFRCVKERVFVSTISDRFLMLYDLCHHRSWPLRFTVSCIWPPWYKGLSLKLISVPELNTSEFVSVLIWDLYTIWATFITSM